MHIGNSVDRSFEPAGITSSPAMAAVSSNGSGESRSIGLVAPRARPAESSPEAPS